MKKSNKVLVLALVGILCCIICGVLFPLSIYGFIAPVQIDGQSMSPNFHSGEVWLTTRASRISRLQVRVIQLPNRLAVVKRIIGLPGETVEIDNGQVLINDKVLDETIYLESGAATKSATFIGEGQLMTIPAGKYFVLGDNRSNSLDSRYKEIGFIDAKYIGAMLWYRLK